MLLILPAGGPPSLSQPGKINYFQHSFWTDSTVSDTCSKPTLSGKEVEWWATCLTCRLYLFCMAKVNWLFDEATWRGEGGGRFRFFYIPSITPKKLLVNYLKCLLETRDEITLPSLSPAPTFPATSKWFNFKTAQSHTIHSQFKRSSPVLRSPII